MMTPKGRITAVALKGLLLSVILLIGPSVLAQTAGSATLRGTVRDQNGAVVPNASVTLVNVRTNFERKLTTGDEGTYVFPALDPGTYTVRIEASGFKSLTQSNVSLSPSDTRALDLTLEIGATSETVTISGTIEEIKTETGEKSNTITAAQIENLSIISRSSLELLRILPGVVAPDQSSYQIVGFGDASAYAVNGQRGTNNNVSVDGSRVIDIGCNCGSIVSLNNDMVQEVSIKTSNYAAEHGNSGVQISGTTKSGGRDFHGSLYNYTRHDALAANDRFRNYLKADIKQANPNATANDLLPGQKQLGRFYYPGGNIGGPIYLPKKVFGPLGGFNEDRNRLFFFIGFEYQKQDFSAQPKTSTVPTLRQRQGDFSELLPGGVLGQNATVNIPAGFPGAGSAAPGNNLAPYIDPIGRTLMNFYPLPNFNDPTGRNNYVATPVTFRNRRDLKMRFDYKISDNTNLFVRITRERELEDGAYGIWWGPSTFELPTHNQSQNLGRSVAVGLTSVISPTLTNEIVISGSKLTLDNGYEDPDKLKLSTLGLENIWRLPFDNTQFGRQSDNISLSLVPWASGQLWSPGTNPIFAWNDSFSINDNLTKVVGSHTLKFGAVIEQGNKRQNFQDNSEGTISFNNWNPHGTGNDWGDLLVGQLTDVQHGTRTPIGNYRFYNYEFYAQDQWKVRPNFTLEYGLRAARMSANFERKGFDILFDPSSYRRGAGYYVNGDPFRPNGVLSVNQGTLDKSRIDTDPILLGPRLNFAWDIWGNQKLVVRGGYGIFYNRVQGNFQYDATLRSPTNGNVNANIGLFTTIPGVNQTFDSLGGLTFRNMAQVNFNGQTIRYNPLELAAGGGDIISPNEESTRIPTTYTTSLSLASRLPFSSVLEASYVGTFGRHLPSRRAINFIPQGALLQGGVAGDPGSSVSFLANPNCDPGAVDANGNVTRRGNCQIINQTATANLNNVLNRTTLDAAALNLFRPFPDMGYIRFNEYNATSNYHSLQVTLSRQTGKNLQYFATYTFSKVLGLTSGEFADQDPIDARGRSYGVLNYDRTHVFNLSYNYNIPDLSPFKNALARGLLNGWQMSGITTFASGTPIRLRYVGDLGGSGVAIAALGTDAFSTGGQAAGAIAPVYLRNPATGNTDRGSAAFDLGAISFPAFGSTGPYIPQFYFRTPNQSNWDISFFKNFRMSESKNLQFRVGIFNAFNQAFAKNIDTANPNNSDIHLTLDTRCTRTPVNQTLVLADGTVTSFTQTFANGIGGTQSGICDPTKPFTFADDTINRFGTVLTKRGNRVIELAVKFNF
ncbi:MAG: carboxypeptidase regulatory-like domain-containing protein [Blastocatellales bacterium]